MERARATTRAPPPVPLTAGGHAAPHGVASPRCRAPQPRAALRHAPRRSLRHLRRLRRLRRLRPPRSSPRLLWRKATEGHGPRARGKRRRSRRHPRHRHRYRCHRRLRRPPPQVRGKATEGPGPRARDKQARIRPSDRMCRRDARSRLRRHRRWRHRARAQARGPSCRCWASCCYCCVWSAWCGASRRGAVSTRGTSTSTLARGGAGRSTSTIEIGQCAHSASK